MSHSAPDFGSPYLKVLALQVELCSPRLIASRAEARWRPSGCRPGSGHRASHDSLLLCEWRPGFLGGLF